MLMVGRSSSLRDCACTIARITELKHGSFGSTIFVAHWVLGMEAEKKRRLLYVARSQLLSSRVTTKSRYGETANKHGPFATSTIASREFTKSCVRTMLNLSIWVKIAWCRLTSWRI